MIFADMMPFGMPIIISVIIASIIIVSLALGFGLALILRRTSSRPDEPAIAERLRVIAEQLNLHQKSFGEGLQNQERHLGEKLQLELSQMGKKIDLQLDQSSQRQHSSLSHIHERLAVIDRASKSLTDLSGQVLSLQNILSNKQARGAFGEQILESIIRDQLPASIYEFQAHLDDRGKERRIRADCLLKLPPPAQPIVIDAKFPRESYRAYLNHPESEREKSRKVFAADIQKHVVDIAEKYIIDGVTEQNAIMFVPSESIYAAIYKDIPHIAEEARRRHVLIVSPTTLWAMVHTLNAVLRNVSMREQAGIIQQEVGKVLADIGRLGKRVDSLDGHFRSANKDIQDIRISKDKISQRGEHIVSLDIKKSEKITPDAPPPILSDDAT